MTHLQHQEHLLASSGSSDGSVLTAVDTLLTRVRSNFYLSIWQSRQDLGPAAFAHAPSEPGDLGDK